MEQVEIKHLGKWLFLGAIVGIVSGAGAVFFHWLLGVTGDFFLGRLVGYMMPKPAGEGGFGNVVEVVIRHRWLLVLVPALGGLLAGLLIYTFAPEAEGHGTDAVIEAFHRKRGQVRPIVPVIKTLASALTIGTGGSAGREGPIAQIGSGFGSLLGRLLRLSARDTRILLLAGTAGGIGSIFRAPLGGALFAVEVLYRHPDFESDAIIPSIISAIFAYVVFGLVFTFSPVFETEYYVFHANDLFFFGLLGLVLVPFGFVYVRTFYRVRDYFRSLRIPNHVKPMIGGFVTGLLLFFFPQVAGTSYGWVQLALYGRLGVGLLLALAIAKIVATSLTIGSGGSGGVFAPSLAIGAFIGGAFGQWIHNVFPNMVTTPTAFAVVGMGSFFAAVGKVPLASLVMVVEMTGNYDLLVPMTLALSLSYLFSGRWSIYENQVSSRIDSPAHQGELIMDVMEQIRVRDAIKLPMKVVKFHEKTNLVDALRKAATVPYHCFPVVDESGKIRGFLFAEELRSLLYRGEMDVLGPILIVGDLIHDRIPKLSPDDDLKKALALFIATGHEELPVIDEKGECVGILSHKELINAYDRAIVKHRALIREENERPLRNHRQRNQNKKS